MGDKEKPFELSAFQSLCLYAWPGNVRELGKVVSSAPRRWRAARSGSASSTCPATIAAAPRLKFVAGAPQVRGQPPSADELEALMKRFQGNMMRVARELDRKPALVYRWARAVRPAGGGLPAQG